MAVNAFVVIQPQKIHLAQRLPCSSRNLASRSDLSILFSHRRGKIVRIILLIAAAVLLIGWFAISCDLPQRVCDSPVVTTAWRHTVDGWEKVNTLFNWQQSSVASDDLPV